MTRAEGIACALVADNAYRYRGTCAPRRYRSPSNASTVPARKAEKPRALPAHGSSLDRDPRANRGGCHVTISDPTLAQFLDRGSRVFENRSKQAGSPMHFQFDDCQSAVSPSARPGPADTSHQPPTAGPGHKLRAAVLT